MSAPALNPTLAHRLWPADSGRAVLRAVLLALFGSLLLWVSAKVQVPFYPVPMTFQGAVVLLIGLAYGPRLAAATLLLYLAEGAVGLPVFAGTPERGIGLAYMVGPTGGYLAGFLAAAVIAGWTAERSRHWLTTVLGLLAAYNAWALPGALNTEHAELSAADDDIVAIAGASSFVVDGSVQGKLRRGPRGGGRLVAAGRAEGCDHQGWQGLRPHRLTPPSRRTSSRSPPTSASGCCAMRPTRPRTTH